MVVAGTSAGAYGALFYMRPIAELFPDAKVILLGDSGVPPLDRHADVLRGWGADSGATTLWGVEARPVTLLEAYRQAARIGPRARLAQMTSDRDAIQSAFYLVSGSPRWHDSTYSLLADVETAVPTFRSFIVAGGDHGLCRWTHSTRIVRVTCYCTNGCGASSRASRSLPHDVRRASIRPVGGIVLRSFHFTVMTLVALARAADPCGAQGAGADSTEHLVVPLKRDGVVVETVSGNPKVAGAPYVLRIHNEDNLFVFPHTHPEDEHVAVLQGTWHLGSGARFDRSKLQPLRVGDFTRIPRRMPHFAWSEGATIIQVHGIGPFRVDLVDRAYVLSRATTDSSVQRHFMFRVGDTVSFDDGRGIVRDGMASPANGIAQYLIETANRGEMVLEERVLRRASPLAAARSAPTAHGRLAPLVGRWTMASLPAGVTLVEICEWFVGERHVVCRMRSGSAEWQRGALTVFSYDATDSSYAMSAFRSGGQQSVARGRARGDTLVLEGELRTGAGQKRTRVIIVPRSDGFDLTEQEPDGQAGWRPSAPIRYVRSRG